MEERRLLPRWEIKKEAMVWMPQTQDFSFCMIENMHIKGMSISFHARLAQHRSINMSFALGDELDFINIEARILWIKQEHGRYVYGLTFIKIAEEDKKMMYHYINTNCYEQFRNVRWVKGAESPLFINGHIK